MPFEGDKNLTVACGFPELVALGRGNSPIVVCFSSDGIFDFCFFFLLVGWLVGLRLTVDGS